MSASRALDGPINLPESDWKSNVIVREGGRSSIPCRYGEILIRHGVLDPPLSRRMTDCRVVVLYKMKFQSGPEDQFMGGRHFYVYILASQIGGTLYIGVTNDLVRRVWEHRESVVEGFTQKYAIHRLVYFEQLDDIESAIRREKQLKKWNRNWKIRLIEENNPNWDDLYPGIAPP